MSTENENVDWMNYVSCQGNFNVLECCPIQICMELIYIFWVKRNRQIAWLCLAINFQHHTFWGILCLQGLLIIWCWRTHPRFLTDERTGLKAENREEMELADLQASWICSKQSFESISWLKGCNHVMIQAEVQNEQWNGRLSKSHAGPKTVWDTDREKWAIQWGWEYVGGDVINLCCSTFILSFPLQLVLGWEGKKNKISCDHASWLNFPHHSHIHNEITNILLSDFQMWANAHLMLRRIIHTRTLEKSV